MDFRLTALDEVDANNPVAWDLYMEGGSFGIVEGDASVLQHMQIRMRFLKGEWFMNTLEGFPYFQHVFKKSPEEYLIRDLFRQCAVGTPGVVAMKYFTLGYIPSQRKAAPKITVILDSGSVRQVELTDPFIMTVSRSEKTK